MNGDCEKDKKSSEFHNQLAKFLEYYRMEDAGLEPFDVMEGLASQLKIEACIVLGSYYQALGMLSELLLKDFEEMFHNINSQKEE